MDEHLAGCKTCHEVFAETLRFALDEEAAGVLPRRALTAIPFMQRPAFRMAAVLAARGHGRRRASSSSGSRALQARVAELSSPSWPRRWAPDRFVEPRLTGGFQHGRLVILRSADRPQGLDAHTPAVLAAIARIRERAGERSVPRNRSAHSPSRTSSRATSAKP